MKPKINHLLKVLFVFLICFVEFSFAQQETFEETLKNTKMQFNMPPGFVEVATISNKSMLNSYAYQDIAKQIEVRYRIDPFTLESKEHNSEQTRAAIIMSVLYNISDKSLQIPELSKRLVKMNPEMIKKDYNGDDMFMSRVMLGEEFGMGYKECMIAYLHKTDVANVWIFVLFNDLENFKKLGSLGVIDALKFKE